ncbi:uncharacterized protein CIMG_13607 [Coccidioides immitis RS]|uniref:Uncharacterized protein n=1 Tax=Coccidioides immitis (strain RS) TaxID=246410 RepID=A0A0D8JW68_COCIM|nr:uncharacterized protein CIMG_13607 [Coccidioides immitis RS]KJF61369.1 hypothetical protein CIMG_13607 [Coccidioides immitis RS]
MCLWKSNTLDGISMTSSNRRNLGYAVWMPFSSEGRERDRQAVHARQMAEQIRSNLKAGRSPIKLINQSSDPQVNLFSLSFFFFSFFPFFFFFCPPFCKEGEHERRLCHEKSSLSVPVPGVPTFTSPQHVYPANDRAGEAMRARKRRAARYIVDEERRVRTRRQRASDERSAVRPWHSKTKNYTTETQRREACTLCRS